MGTPMHYQFAKGLFDSRRKPRDYKAWKTDTHITESPDGTLVFSTVEFVWKRNPKTSRYERKEMTGRTPLASITPSNVLTLLAPDTDDYPGMRHITTRNRIAEITGFSVWSDMGNYRNRETPVRMSARRYGESGWEKQAWCVDGPIPYKAGTQFQLHIPGSVVDCINPPKDMKQLVKHDAVQRVKAETAVIRKLAKAMLRVGFDDYIEKRMDHYSAIPPKTKPMTEVDYRNPSSDDAMAVLAAGLRAATRPDEHKWDATAGKYIQRPRDVRIQILRERVLDNGMKALRQHIYETTGGYEQVEA